jgi:hypothetical protein
LRRIWRESEDDAPSKAVAVVAGEPLEGAAVAGNERVARGFRLAAVRRFYCGKAQLAAFLRPRKNV